MREAVEWVSQRARWVRIDPAAIEAWADRVNPADIKPAPRPTELQIVGEAERTGRWVLLVDCLNFCFWCEGEPWQIDYQGRSWGRYMALVAALHRAIGQDERWLTPEHWASVEHAEVERIFAGRGRLPMMEDRTRIIQATGRTLLERYGGRVMAMVEAAQFDAGQIAARIACDFEDFRDMPDYDGRQVPILKRAQIFASDLAATWRDTGGPTIQNVDSLTAFADYRLPQLLRHWHMIRLEPELEQRIEAGSILAAGSEEEIELRACTVWAVELMVQALQRRRNLKLPSWLVDEYLWDHSHDPDVTVKHHYTLTWYY